MVTYIISKAYDKKFLRRNIKKKLSDVDRQKKACFPPEVKKKFASNKNSRPSPPDIPQISPRWCVPYAGPELAMPISQTGIY